MEIREGRRRQSRSKQANKQIQTAEDPLSSAATSQK